MGFYINSSWASDCDGPHQNNELSPFSFDTEASNLECDSLGRITNVYAPDKHEPVAHFTYAEEANASIRQFLQVETSNTLAQSVWDFDLNGFALLRTTSFADQAFMWHTAYNDIGALTLQDYPSGLSLNVEYAKNSAESKILIELGKAGSQFVSAESEHYLPALKALGLPDSLIRNDIGAYILETTSEEQDSTLKRELEDLLHNHKTLPLYLTDGHQQPYSLIHLGNFNNILAITGQNNQTLVEFLYRDQSSIGIVIPTTHIVANTQTRLHSSEDTGIVVSQASGSTSSPSEKNDHGAGADEDISTTNQWVIRPTMTIIEHPPSTVTATAARKFFSEDRDGDDLLDAWEILYFSGLHRDGSGDFDRDGLTDKEEFRRNSNPKLNIDGARRHTKLAQLNALIHHF